MDGYNGPLKQALTSGSGFKPIGELSTTGTKYFYGTFDGDNKAICSMYINIDSDENVRTGLFSTSYGEIRNLGLVNTNITVKGVSTSVGGLTGTSYNNLTNSYVTGNISVTGSSWMPVGGLCGVMQEEADIENCYNLANITATNIQEEEGIADIGCGGIVGQGQVNINKCFNKGNIIANGGNNNVAVGGICGHTDNNGVIKNCYNSARVEGDSETQLECYIGGIFGSSNSSNIAMCYNSGNIVGKAAHLYIAGIVARQADNDITINDVFNIGSVTIESKTINVAGGIIGEMSTISNHVNIKDAYNVGLIEEDYLSSGTVGSIAGTNWSDVMTYNNCYYLKGTYDLGVGYGTSTGVTEWDSLEDFPSVLSVVNGENAFKEDTNNINNGYPILEWQ